LLIAHHLLSADVHQSIMPTSCLHYSYHHKQFYILNYALRSTESIAINFLFLFIELPLIFMFNSLYICHKKHHLIT